MYKRIGIDLHGVMNTNAKLFRVITRKMVLQNKAVCIVSGPPRKDIEAELEEYGFKEGINYHCVYSLVDYLKEKGVNMRLDRKNTWWASDEDWWSAKAEICKKLELDIMIDDKEGYSKYFNDIDTQFFLFSQTDELLRELS